MVRAFNAIPISYRIPGFVALLMIIISAAISWRVLDRLAATQERSLNALAESYMDGLSAALTPAVLREDPWETFDTIDRSANSYRALGPIETVVTGASGTVLAASDPKRVDTFSQLPTKYRQSAGTGQVEIDPERSTGFVRRDLAYQGQPIGAIYATFDVSHLFAERREVLVTLLLTNALLTALCSLVGFLLVRRMIAPMSVLEGHMREASTGVAVAIPPNEIPATNLEAANLFRGYNALVEAQRQRAELTVQLAEEEKLSSLGRLASGMAHEINNPLGGLFNAIDTLKQHGDTPGVRETSIRLIERGLAGIRDVVQAALATYRPERSDRALSVDDFEDARLLVMPEIRRKRQRLSWQVDWQAGTGDGLKGGPIRRAVLNLLLNASAATPELSELEFMAIQNGADLVIRVSDSGPGLPSSAADILTSKHPDPMQRFGSGLGLWMVRRTIDDLGGTINVIRRPTGGAAIVLNIPLPPQQEHVHAA